jgi:hypothetical protein
MYMQIIIIIIIIIIIVITQLVERSFMKEEIKYNLCV